MGGSYFFNIFLNDLETELNGIQSLFNYADDSNIVAPVWKNYDSSADLVNDFLKWPENNQILCNPSKCKELTFRKNDEIYAKIRDIPQCDNLMLLGVTLQSDCKFNEHVKRKLMKANKCLYILKTLRKEQYNQTEIDHLFRSLVLPNITHGLSITALLNQTLRLYSVFLDRCYKRNYISFPIRIHELLQKQDTQIFNTVTTFDDHPLAVIIPMKRGNF